MSLVSTPAALSIVIPVFNEYAGLVELERLLTEFKAEASIEIILVDGGSTDGTFACLTSYVSGETNVVDIKPAVSSVDNQAETSFSRPLILLSSAKGRGAQMNAGAKQATGNVILFLHADTQFKDKKQMIKLLLSLNEQLNTTRRVWGRFDVQIAGDNWMFSVISFFINLRSRLSHIATGDQAIFVKRTIFEQAGGFADIPLMEDIELSKKLKIFSPSLCLKQKVLTSARRWQTFGIWPTIFLMWQLRFDYWRGVSVDKLAQRYR